MTSISNMKKIYIFMWVVNIVQPAVTLVCAFMLKNAVADPTQTHTHAHTQRERERVDIRRERERRERARKKA